MISALIRNSVKLMGKFVLAGGAVYVTAKQGFWDESTSSQEKLSELQQKVKAIVLPYTPEDVPSINRQTLKDTWNHGVDTVFNALDSTPDTVKKFTSNAVSQVASFINLNNDNNKKS